MRFYLRIVFLFIVATVLINVAFQVAHNWQIYQDSSIPRALLIGKKYWNNLLNEASPVLMKTTSVIPIYQAGKEVRHLVFLKVHKAASGTAASIFFRFGIERNLTFVLPLFYNIVDLWNVIDEKYIYPRLNQPFDIITSHQLYNKSAIEKFVHKDAVYIGILREPFQQFISSINYMHPEYIFKLSETNPVHMYLKDPLKFERKNNITPRYSWVNNRQAVEFGFPDSIIMNKSQLAIDGFLQILDKEFHLVLIAEHFDESIILMRRMLNWGIKDILYRRSHVRGGDLKSTLPLPYDRNRFYSWASVDCALYDFFYTRLWKQIKRAGSDFLAEVLYFKRIRAEVDDFCKVTRNDTVAYFIPQSPWNDAFNISFSWCRLMQGEEYAFLKTIGKRQYGINLDYK